MSRQRRSDKYYDNSSSFSTLDTIRSLCNDASSGSPSAISAIRGVCDDFNVQEDTRTSPTTIDAIREICNGFVVHSETRNSSSTIDAIKKVCDGCIVQSDTRTSSSAIDAIKKFGNGCSKKDLIKPYDYCQPEHHYPSDDRNNYCPPKYHHQSEERNDYCPPKHHYQSDERNDYCPPKKHHHQSDESNSYCPPKKHHHQSEESSSYCPPKKHKSRQCVISEGSTMDDIKVLCDQGGGGYRSSCQIREDYYRPCERYDPGNSYFNSVITPVTGLTPQYSGVTGTVQFRMRRKNKTVTLQWEPFSGTMAASGVALLTVMQSIWNTPPYPMSWPIMIRYKDINRMTNITIDPSSTTGNIKFYLNTDGTATSINMGDAFYIYAGSISWIVD